MLRSYIDELRFRAEAAQAREYAQPQPRQEPTTVKPLADQITELMATLPPAQRDRPWSMDDLVTRLSGRYRARPHAKHVGEALRRLGWRRTRDWTAEGEGRRVWSRP